MDTKSIIEITISSLSAFAVIGTLAFTIYFQIKTNKINKNLDIAKLLDYAFEMYRHLDYKPLNNLVTDEKKEQEKRIKEINKELLQQFKLHYSRYLFEIDILLSRYKITGKIYCISCKQKQDFNQFLEIISKLSAGEQWEWNISLKIFYSIENNELTVMYCPKCGKKEPQAFIFKIVP